MRPGRRMILGIIGVLGLLVLLVLLPGPFSASVSHALGLDRRETPRTVLTGGLLNPRGMAFGLDGSLYVAEAGSAGRERVVADPEKRRYRVGKTGRLSRIGADGVRTTVADGLPSALTSHDDDIGPTGVAVIGERVYVVTAAGGTPWGDASYDNAVLEVLSDGSTRSIFDYQDYNIRDPSLSRRTDPRADVPGGMPFGMTALGEKLYITDGNLEFVLELGLDGQARRLLEYPTSNFVLTGITTGPDGALYIAEMGAYPYFEATGKITRLALDGTATPAWTGLTTPVAVALAADGTMYAVEYTAPLKQWEDTGRVLQRSPEGQVTVLATGLNFPTAAVLGPDGHLYVANNGHHAPDGSGEIVRLDLAGTDLRARLRQLLAPVLP